jgi:hypothetical protein
MKKSFIDKCLDYEEGVTHIDEYVEIWHNLPAGKCPFYRNDNVRVNSLHSFLGMTQKEYARWVEDPNCLCAILKERRKLNRI